MPKPSVKKEPTRATSAFQASALICPVLGIDLSSISVTAARQRHRLRSALQGELTTGFQVVVGPLQQAARGLGQQDRVPGLAGRRLDAGRDVHRVADHGELEPPAAAHGADDHRARVEPDADADLAAEAPSTSRAISQAAAQRVVGVVGQPLGGAEDRQQAVAEELVGVPLCSSTIGTTSSKNSFRKVTVSRALERSAKGVKSRTSTNITVTSALVALEQLALLEHALGHLGVDVAAERLAQRLALGEPLHHLVEAAGERAQLVARDQRHAGVEVARLDALGGLEQVVDGLAAPTWSRAP